MGFEEGDSKSTRQEQIFRGRDLHPTARAVGSGGGRLGMAEFGRLDTPSRHNYIFYLLSLSLSLSLSLQYINCIKEVPNDKPQVP